MPQNINKNEELKAQLIKNIEDFNEVIELYRTKGMDPSDVEKKKKKAEGQLKKLDSATERFYLYDFKTEVLEEAKKHFSTFSTPPSIYEVRKYLISHGKSVNVGFTKDDEREVITGAAELHLNNKDFHLVINKTVSPSQWVRELRDRGFFVRKEDIRNFIEWALAACVDIQTTCETGEVSKEFASDGLNLIFKSSMVGTGKSYFQLDLINGAKELGIAAEGDVEVPGGETLNHPDESTNLLVCHSDRTDQKVDITTLKQIGRREMYVYRELYHQPVQVKGRAIMLGTTNNKSEYIKDRTFRTINVISIPFASFPDEIKERAARRHEESFTSFFQLSDARSVREKFLSHLADLADLADNNYRIGDEIDLLLGNGEYFSISSAKLAKLTTMPFADLAILALERAHNTSLWHSRSISVSALRKNAPDVIDTDAKEAGVCRFFQAVWASKDFGLKAKQNQRDTWWQWTIKGTILEYLTTDHLLSAKEMTCYDVVDEAQAEWDKWVVFFDSLDNPTPPTPRSDDDGAEDELSSMISAQAPAQKPAQASEPVKAEAQPATEPVKTKPANPWAAALSHVKQPLAEYQPSLAEHVEEPAPEPESEAAPTLVNEEMEPIDRLMAKNAANPQVLANLKELKERRKDGPSAADRIEACASFTSSEASAIYDEIAGIEPEDSAKFDYIDEPKHSYRDRYTTTPTDNPDDEYQTINPIKEGASRADDNVASMRNFVLEMDDTPREEQKALAAKLMKEGIVNRVVDSGNKSLHMRITVANAITTKDEYKAVHNYLNERFFEGRADRKCSNPSRFTRNPNGYRPDTQKRQTAIVNPDARPLDITEQLKIIRSAKKVEESYRQLRKEMAQDANFTKPSCSIEEFVAGWKDSDWKERCEAILAGIGDRNDAFGFVAFLKKAGYVWDEINAAIPNLDSSNKRDGWNIRECDFDKLEVD